MVDGVRLARERGWQVSVRAGGHSWAGWSVRDDALLIDLGAHARDDLRRRGRHRAAGGARAASSWRRSWPAHGRMFTGGHCESVGLGGFLLQGGQGWNSRRWGWGCENVLGVDVVTADGELVHADATRTRTSTGPCAAPGPAFFGVVTRFHLRTYPLTPMWHDTRVFRLDDLEPLLEFMHDVLPRLDVAVEPVIAATRLRTGEVELLLHTTLVADSAEAADALLAPFDARARRARSSTCAARPRWPRRTPRRRCRTPRATATAPTASGPNAPRRRAGAAAARALERAAHPPLVLDLVRLGADARAARHGVLARGQRLPRDVRDLDRPGRRRAPPRVGARPHRAARRGGGARASTSATPTSRGGRTASWPSANLQRLAEIRAARDPDGVFVPTWGSNGRSKPAVDVQGLPGDRLGGVACTGRRRRRRCRRARGVRGTA